MWRRTNELAFCASLFRDLIDCQPLGRITQVLEQTQLDSSLDHGGLEMLGIISYV